MTTPADGPKKGPTKISDLGQDIVKIESTKEYMHYLNSLAANPADLKDNGYVIKQFTIDELNSKSRCQRCDARCPANLPPTITTAMAKTLVIDAPFKTKFGLSLRDGTRSQVLPGYKKSFVREFFESHSDGTVNSRSESTVSPCSDSATDSLEKRDSQVPQVEAARGLSLDQKKPVEVVNFQCKWHSGTVQSKVWTCCGQHISEPACEREKDHLPRDLRPLDMAERFQCAHTLRNFPPLPNRSPRRAAVVLKCNMGIAHDNEMQLIRVTLIDYFTAEVLIDRLVWPDVAMAHLNTQYSGITMLQLNQANREGDCFTGTQTARFWVWEHVGPDTVVVVHGGSADLAALNWIHPVVVDSLIIETEFQKAQREQEEADREAAEAERLWLEGGPGPSTNAKVPEMDEKEKKKQMHSQRAKLSLKSLAQERLGRKIQVGPGGHNSLEDALATRDIVHWHMMRILKEVQEENEEIYLS